MPTVKLNVEGLDKIIKGFKTTPTIKVGILASTDHRSGESSSNAEIGAAHEFGSAKVPMRSFLRVPLTDHFSSFLENAGAFNKDSIREIYTTGSLVTWMKKIGQVAVNVVETGFATGGFGKWKPWKSGYSNNTGMILVDTTQLSKSITSEVSEGK